MELHEIDKQKRLSREIGAVLKAWFKANNITPTEVANRLDVSTAYVSALFAGKTIGKKVAKKLHELFGLSESFLLTGQGLIDDPLPMSQADLKSMAIYQQAIQKANRIHCALHHLVTEGVIDEIIDVAPIIDLLPSVVSQSMRYDPEGRYDFVIVKIVKRFPQFSIEWLLTGEGQMIKVPTSPYEEVMQLRHELEQARNDFRDATYRLTQALRTLSPNSTIDLAADEK